MLRAGNLGQALLLQRALQECQSHRAHCQADTEPAIRVPWRSSYYPVLVRRFCPRARLSHVLLRGGARPAGCMRFRILAPHCSPTPARAVKCRPRSDWWRGCPCVRVSVCPACLCVHLCVYMGQGLNERHCGCYLGTMLVPSPQGQCTCLLPNIGADCSMGGDDVCQASSRCVAFSSTMDEILTQGTFWQLRSTPVLVARVDSFVRPVARSHRRMSEPAGPTEDSTEASAL